jgi:thioredoxin-related protein
VKQARNGQKYELMLKNQATCRFCPKFTPDISHFGGYFPQKLAFCAEKKFGTVPRNLYFYA